MAQANFSVALIFWFFLIKQKEQLESGASLQAADSVQPLRGCFTVFIIYNYQC